MKNIVELLYKQVEVATEDYWDAKLILENNHSQENEARLSTASVALDEACRIRDQYIMENVI